MKRILMTVLLCLLLAGIVSAEGQHIYDEVGLLYDVGVLESEAAALSEQYQCGVYFAALEDYRSYGYDVESAAEAFYTRCDLGYGEEKSGILLLLSMEDRDYDLAAFGYGNYAFTDYGKEVLADYFLDDLGDNDWQAGVEDFLRGCDELLAQAAAGEPLDVYYDDPYYGGSYYDDPFYDDDFFFDPEYGYGVPVREERSVGQWLLLLVALPCGLSLIICLILKSRLRSVKQATNAEAYASGRILLTKKQETYLHTTHSRTKVASSNTGGHGGGGHHGGTHVSSGGFSHHSGKF